MPHRGIDFTQLNLAAADFAGMDFLGEPHKDALYALVKGDRFTLADDGRLTTVNRPRTKAAGLALSILGRVLGPHLSRKARLLHRSYILETNPEFTAKVSDALARAWALLGSADSRFYRVQLIEQALNFYRERNKQERGQDVITPADFKATWQRTERLCSLAQKLISLRDSGKQEALIFVTKPDESEERLTLSEFLARCCDGGRFVAVPTAAQVTAALLFRACAPEGHLSPLLSAPDEEELRYLARRAELSRDEQTELATLVQKADDKLTFLLIDSANRALLTGTAPAEAADTLVYALRRLNNYSLTRVYDALHNCGIV